jgi:hypothetical protein
MALAGTSGSIETVARPVDQSPTATNAHDLVTSKRGGPGPYRAVEPWLLLLLLLLLLYIILFTKHTFCQNAVRRMRWAGHVARMGEGRGAYRILVGRPEGRRPLGRPKRRWEDNIKMDLQEVGWNGVAWIDMAQDRDRWRAVVNAVMNLRVP